jgi:hypothetical protein
MEDAAHVVVGIKMWARQEVMNGVWYVPYAAYADHVGIPHTGVSNQREAEVVGNT